MTWDAWIERCDALAALMTEGRLTSDLDYDWRRAYEWGEAPARAVTAAILRTGCTDDE